MEKISFTVSYSPDDEGYLVHEVTNAYSFCRIPVGHQYDFGNDKAKALDQVRRLHAWQAKGNVVTVKDYDTPGRFEVVADTKYGCAW